MQNLPHKYSVSATSGCDGNVDLTSAHLAKIESAAPAEFGGPGDRWSPETLLVAAVADCFILTFKAIAQGSKMDWISISCIVEGVLDRVDNVSRFTDFHLRVVLDAQPGTDEQKATRLLQKSELACLITNSLNAETHLDTEIRIGV
ncbi:MAG: organic hydroperoxide reductase OsmC/OhrA [Gammaproteobacteria bacterium]|jgi:organic hydroperoxide reductase OsmC/OhrA